MLFLGTTPYATIVCVETYQSANQVFGSSVEKEQHEDNECNLPESATSTA